MRKNKQGMSVGVISLIMIFVVFLLASLAILSLTTASANTRIAKKALTMQTDYYNADTKAQETLAKVDGVLKTAGPSPEALTAVDSTVVYNPETGVIAYNTKMNDTSALQVELLVSGNSYSIVRWQTITTGDWKVDGHNKDIWKGN